MHTSPPLLLVQQYKAHTSAHQHQDKVQIHTATIIHPTISPSSEVIKRSEQFCVRLLPFTTSYYLSFAYTSHIQNEQDTQTPYFEYS